MANDGNSDDGAAVLKFPLGSRVVPGDRLGKVKYSSDKKQLKSGSGTYQQQGHIFASRVGRLTLLPDDHDNDNQTVVSVVASKPSPLRQVPRVDQLVLLRVERVEVAQAAVEIVMILSSNDKHIDNDDEEAAMEKNEWSGSILLPPGGYPGVIRKEDVRSGTAEELQMYDCFRAGDVVKGRILARQARHFLVTTAEPPLGVIRAFSATSGLRMVPLNWKEMKCPQTGVKELRKCARPKTKHTPSDNTSAAAMS